MNKTRGHKPVPLIFMLNLVWNEHASIQKYRFIETIETHPDSNQDEDTSDRKIHWLFLAVDKVFRDLFQL